MYFRLTEGPAYHCIQHNSGPNVTRSCSGILPRAAAAAARWRQRPLASWLGPRPPTPPTLLLLLREAAASDAVAGAAAAGSQLSRLLRMTGDMTGGSIDCRPS